MSNYPLTNKGENAMRLPAGSRRALCLLPILICALVCLGLFSSAAYAAEVGNQWNYTLVHEVRVNNLGATSARDITVEIPLTDAYAAYPYCQSVGLELSPYPDRIVTDAAGRRTAVYDIRGLAAGQSIILTQRFALKVCAVTYPLDDAARCGYYTAEELYQLDEYLQPTEDIQSAAPAVVAFTEAHADADLPPYEEARELFSAVNLALDYSTAAADQSATATLMRRSGSCEGYVNLYMACLRAAGVACRQISGYLFQPAVHVSEGYVDPVNGDVYLEQLRHTWVEIYLPDAGWVPADPTFTYTFLLDGVDTKFVNWSYFANVSSANRYVCFRQGDPNEDKIFISATGGQVTTDFSALLTAGLKYTPFNDISGHWAEEPIRYCVENGLFNGVTPQRFAPETSMTRAMFVTVLGRLYEKLAGGLPESGGPAISFFDVIPGSYYEPYLDWATSNGIISGYGNGRFGPDDPVTREQMATIMASFLRAAGYSAAVSPGDLSGFADEDEVSAWAVDGVAACVGCGLLSGYPDGCFHPDYRATRAQVAAILQRLSVWIAGQNRV